MGNNPLFSIIIPVYNVENYIDECLNSIINQSFKDYEIILVDDGSLDNCPKICDEYAQKYDFIKAYHKENGGLSSARNYGIKLSNGKYVGFIDSDDYWNDVDFLSNLNSIIEQKGCDMILYGYGELKDDIFKPVMNFDGYKSDYDYTLNELITNNWIISSACTKFVKLDIVKNNGFDFRYGVTSEDIEWTLKLITACKSYAVYPKNIYSYRQQESSITHNIKRSSLEDLYSNLVFSVDNVDKLNADKKVLFNYLSYQYITLLNLYVLFHYGDKDLLSKAKSLKYLLSYGTNKKVKMVALFDKLFGFRLMLVILKLFLKIRKSNR